MRLNPTQARVALTEVAATIKGLREDLDRLRREMNSFNKGISQHRIHLTCKRLKLT